MIKSIFLDVDGTLTDGKITLDDNGNETKSFNVKDGYIISKVCKKGDSTVYIITGRQSQVVDIRAKELGINKVYQGVSDKHTLLKEIAVEDSLILDECLYIGDDDNDLEVMKLCGYTAAPSDCSFNIRNIVDVIANLPGGKGAVREIIEDFIKKGEINV